MKPAVQTKLYRAMIASGRYDHDDAIEAITEMRESVANGGNPEELLHDESFEPDYVFDIL